MARPSKRLLAIMDAGERKAAMRKKRTSGIHINPAHKGRFTAKAKKAGMSVQSYAEHVLANKNQYDKATVEEADLAHNAPKFNH